MQICSRLLGVDHNKLPEMSSSKFSSLDDFTLKRYTYYTMSQFEFDPEKSRSNLEKHGIDFVDAQKLWKIRPT